MAKKKVYEVPASESPEVNLATEMAKYDRVSCIKAESFDKLVEALKPLGCKFELRKAHRGDYKNGKEPFAYKVKMMSCSFVVDLS